MRQRAGSKTRVTAEATAEGVRLANGVGDAYQCMVVTDAADGRFIQPTFARHDKVNGRHRAHAAMAEFDGATVKTGRESG